MKVRAICIDDKNKPSIIPSSKWIKENKIYHINHIYTSTHEKTRNVLMYGLSEIDILIYPPYGAFRADRFAVLYGDIDKLFELMKLCNELNNVDINEILNGIETTELIPL